MDTNFKEIEVLAFLKYVNNKDTIEKFIHLIKFIRDIALFWIHLTKKMILIHEILIEYQFLTSLKYHSYVITPLIVILSICILCMQLSDKSMNIPINKKENKIKHQKLFRAASIRVIFYHGIIYRVSTIRSLTFSRYHSTVA